MTTTLPDLQEALPNATLFRQMIPCPSCGAEYCIDGIRPGPAILGITQNSFIPICLNCWHKGKKGRTDQLALENWNKDRAALGIRELRLRAGLTVPQLAERAGIGEASIYQYELHQHTPSQLTKHKLAAVLGVKTSEI